MSAKGKGRGRASGAGTVVNAVATYKGSAFGIDLWTEAEVEIGDDFRGVTAEMEVAGESRVGDTKLIERCVELVLQKFGLPLRGFVKTRSEVPVGSGLKSSSAAANAAVVATLDAAGRLKETSALDAVRLGVEAALDVGVSVTGAFDDACASLLGGFVVTDNRNQALLKQVERDSEVLFLVPEEKAFTAETNVKRSRLVAPWVSLAFDLALEERFEEAMTLNGFLYCAALNFDPEPILRALECGVKGVSLSGTGPSFVALVGEEAEAGQKGAGAELREAWSELGSRITGSRIAGRVLKTKINNQSCLSRKKSQEIIK